VIVADAERGRIVLWNPAAEQVFGYTEAEALALPLEALVPEPLRARHRAGLARYAASGHGAYIDSHTILELPALQKSGEEVQVELTLSPLAVASRDRRLVLAIVRDVSDRRRAERAVEASEARYRQMFETNQAVKLLIDPRSGAILDANSAAAEFYGYPLARLRALRLSDLSALPSETVAVELERARAQERPYWVTRHRVATGTVRDVEVYSSPVEIDGQRLVYSIIHDITERREAEQRLRLMESVVAHTDDAMLITDVLLDPPGPRIVFANAAFSRMTGYVPEEVLGQTPRLLQGPDTDRAQLDAIREALCQRRAVRVELRNYRKDGSPFWVELSIAPLADGDGQVRHFVAVQRETTARKAAESTLRQTEEQLRQAQKMEAIGRLAGGVAHDFNNVLTVIGGFSEILAADLLPTDARRAYVDEISKAAARAAALTQQLLAFSRKQVLQPRRLDLNEAVEEVVPMLRRLIGEDVELVTVLEPTAGWVEVDPGQLQQVLLNLVVNARDAMPQGGQLSIEVRNTQLWNRLEDEAFSVEAGPYVHLTVRDTGAGMDAATRARVFEPFFTTKEPEKGTGLGLATVYGIVKQSGGYITVASALGQGTSFHVYLPRVESGAAAGGVTADGPASPPGRGTILLVEDEEQVRMLMSRVLQASGYTVLEAAAGTDAVAYGREHPGPIDLLVTDVVMPGMSGREVVEQVAAARPGLRVLYMSGYTDDAMLRHGVGAGTQLLQKPFSSAALVRKVRELLGAPSAGAGA
jgi:PAS domain S-box-containing protein